MKITKTITLKNEIVITLELTIKVEKINLDGHIVDGDIKKMKYATVTKDGKHITRDFDFGHEIDSDKGAARLGDIFLSKETWELVKKATEELMKKAEETEESKIFNAAEEKKQTIIKKNMEENKKLNNQRRKNGYCEKCGTYCYGDCES